MAREREGEKGQVRGERERSLSVRRGGRAEPSAWDPFAAWSAHPFGLIRRMREDMERLFEDFGFGRTGLEREIGGPFSPDVEVCERDGKVVVCADLPGLGKEDIRVDVAGHTLTISGERRREREEERAGGYRSERAYGAFSRSIQLPEGAEPDRATATFRNGVLEVEIPAPGLQAARGRRIEIAEGPTPSAGREREARH